MQKKTVIFVNLKENDMTNEWPILAKPPVDVALFQLKYDIGNSSLNDFTRIEAGLLKDFPIKRENYSAEVNFPSTKFPLGISQVTGTSKTKVSGFLYMSADQKSRIELNEGTFTLIEEHPYKDWTTFSQSVNKYLEILRPAFDNLIVTRISIRFINRFVFDSFENPLDYFKTTVSVSEPKAVPYPVSKYAFNLMIPIDDATYSIVKQDFDKVSDRVNYIFDIDVLKRSNLVFEIGTIMTVLSELRTIKNNLFFGNVTTKLIESCN